MDFKVLTDEQFIALLEKLDRLEAKFMENKSNIIDNQIDNDKFCERLKISKRTAQTWRDDILLPYTQIGGKIYYDIGEVETFFQKYKVQVQASQLRNKRSQYGKK
jgi:Helix-turn-helix domain